MIFTLLVAYQLKHFLADYPLQGKYMLGKFLDKGWVKPLAAHVAVHGAMTAGIAFLVGKPHLALPLALLDASIHFVMDRIKAGRKYLGRFKPLTATQYLGYEHLLSLPEYHGTKNPEGPDFTKKVEARKAIQGNTFFWWSLGLDQMVHHLTHYICIYFLLA